jgi:hypothetical protein
LHQYAFSDNLLSALKFKFMPRPAKPMPPLWRIKEMFAITDQYPSGLMWAADIKGYSAGDPAGRLHPRSGFYKVFIDGTEYLAHRIVYYMRTGRSPDNHAVEHLPSNRTKDNRRELKVIYSNGDVKKGVHILEPMERKMRSQPDESFVFIQDISVLSDEELNEKGYYRGFPCAFGHTIRNTKEHWCYHCIMRIKSRLCGLDVNYINIHYKSKAYAFWKKVNIGQSNECWNIKTKGKLSPRRICFPSYRSEFSTQKAELVTPHKIAYQTTWGDIGSSIVTHTCKNKWCCNPLHLQSRWNQGYPPDAVMPFVLEFDPKKLMAVGRAKRLNREDELLQTIYRKTIISPYEVEAREQSKTQVK